LTVGDDCKSFEGSLGQAVLLAIQDELLDDIAAFRVAIEAPSPIDSFKGEAPVFVGGNQRFECGDRLG
jgi:hypothetical protein